MIGPGVLLSRIEPMKKIARSVRQHRELILNYFRAQKLLSSGVVEGLNNKAKVTMRKSYGFRTFRCWWFALRKVVRGRPRYQRRPKRIADRYAVREDLHSETPGTNVTVVAASLTARLIRDR